MTVTDWEVDLIIVSSSTKDAHNDSVYANGIMQIPITVTISAIDKSTSDGYVLQDSDLANIKLYDFKDPHHTELSGAWSYTDVRNPLFLNSLGIEAAAASAAAVEASAAKTELLGATDSNFRSKTFWVSSTAVEDKLIGAFITQPDKTVITTKHSVYNKSVKVTAKQPVVYTTDNVSVSREDTANGTYNFYTQDNESENWNVVGKTWDQDNYYVTSNVHKFVHADITGTDVTGFGDGHPADWRLANLYGYWANGNILELSFLWPFGTPSTTTAGLFKQGTVGESGQALDGFINASINNRSNAVCLTRLAIDGAGALIGPNWTSSTTFTVYDVYGNTGTFAAGFSGNHNLISVTNPPSK